MCFALLATAHCRNEALEDLATMMKAFNKGPSAKVKPLVFGAASTQRSAADERTPSTTANRTAANQNSTLGAAYTQCGGTTGTELEGWAGPIACEKGLSCCRLSAFFSECVPPTFSCPTA